MVCYFLVLIDIQSQGINMSTPEKQPFEKKWCCGIEKRMRPARSAGEGASQQQPAASRLAVFIDSQSFHASCMIILPSSKG
jgi:hypothetical protein